MAQLEFTLVKFYAELWAEIALKTSLLCRLQVQTLSNVSPVMGKITPVSKITIDFYHWCDFDALPDLESSSLIKNSLFYNRKSYF